MFGLKPTPTFAHDPIKGPWVLTQTNSVYIAITKVDPSINRHFSTSMIYWS